MRKSAAIKVLRTIVENIDNEKISTHNLLLNCLEAAELLNVSSDDKAWITQELSGYEDQNDDNRKELPIYKQAPHYRWVELQGKFTLTGKNKIVHTIAPFAVVYPCDFLEKATSSIRLQTSLVARPKNLWDKIMKGTIFVDARAELPLDQIKSIIMSIRAFVYKFTISTLIASQFDESVSGILVNTRNLISSRLKTADESLLEFINEILDSLNATTNHLHLRIALENIRTVFRRFTGLLLKDNMIDDSHPKESDTSTKVRLILDWCTIQFKGKKGSELDSLRKEIKILLDLINKYIHGEITDTSRSEVERILLKSLIWMAGIIDILNLAGYSWS